MRRLQQLHFPMHHKYLLSGEHMHNQLSSLHFASLALCFLPSLARAADPEDTPASIRVCVLSGDIKGSCLACCPVSQQKVSRMGVAMIGCGALLASTWMPRWARWHVSARTSRRVLCHTTTSPPRLQVVA